MENQTSTSMPANQEAEQALLGAILANNRAYEKVSEFLQADHFTDPLNQRIYKAAGRLIERGQIANSITLKNYFDQDRTSEIQVGADYLSLLESSVVSIINAKDYGKNIHDLHLRRALIAIGEDMVNDARSFEDLDYNAKDQIERAEQRLYDLATTGEYDGGFQEFKAALITAVQLAEVAQKREGKLSGVPTGLVDMDKKLGGLHSSDLIILAGRPSMGKTALATNIAFNAAKAHREEIDASGERRTVDGAVVGFFSLEMSSEQLATRILAEQTGINSHKIRQGELSADDFQNLVITSQELYRIPLYIDDTPALSVSALRTRARKLKRQKGLGLIIVDYLQLLQATPGVKHDNRVNEVSDITRGLKALAKELNIPVIALSQLSRAVEQRDDKRPQLADLRESGSIEQDADVVMFVYREEYYLERAEPSQRADENPDKFHDRHDRWTERMTKVHNTAEVLIAKQRHGPIGTVRLFFDGSLTKFADLMDQDHLPEQG